MRVLTCSDIHGAVPAVEALVATEGRGFDVAVIAGDIGPSAAEFFRALEGLSCPVLYVYGNWDHDLPYDRVFHERFKHLHGAEVAIGDLLFVGYSGCGAQWGQNPIWRTLSAEVEASHRPVLDRLAAAKSVDRGQGDKIDTACNDKIRDITERARDKRRRSFKARLVAVERERELLKMRQCQKVEVVRETRAFARYLSARGEAWRTTALKNRDEVVNRIQRSEHDPGRIVLVTHERLYRLHEDCPGLGGHLFGHRHGFKVSKKHGATFVNVSALDPWSGTHGTYGIIQWEAGSGYRVERQQLPNSDKLAIRCMIYRNAELEQTTSLDTVTGQCWAAAGGPARLGPT